MSFLDPLLDAIAYGAEVTQLGVIGYGAEVRATLAQTDVVAPTWYRARRHRSWRRALDCIETLSSSLGKIQGSYPCGCGFEPHGGCFLYTLCFCHLFVFLLSIFFVYVADLSVQIYLSSSFFCDWFVYSSRFFLSGEHSGCVPQCSQAVNFSPCLLS
jgi:hypothetical protein